MEQILRIVWDNNSDSGKIITLIIITLGFLACFCAFRHISRYNKAERRALDLVRKHMGVETEANPNTLIPIESLREPVKSGTSLIADRLSILAKMRQAKVKVNVNSLQQMSILKESSCFGLALPGYVVGLAMMLGLLGTFVGLAIMTQKLQILSESTQVTSLSAIRKDLGEITRGLKTGFSASLIGLMCSILVSAFNFTLARTQSKFYDEMERFTTEELLPKTIPAVEDANLLEEVSQQLNTGFERLQTITKEHSENVVHLRAIEDAFVHIIDNIKEITHRNAGTDTSASVDGITALIQQLTDVNLSVVDLTAHIPDLAGQFQKTQQETLKQLSAMLKTQQERVEKFFKAQRNELSHPPHYVLMDSLRLFFIATTAGGILLFLFSWFQPL